MTFGDSNSWRDEGSSMHASELCQSLQQHHILVENEKPSANARVEKSFKTDFKNDPTPQALSVQVPNTCFCQFGLFLEKE